VGSDYYFPEEKPERRHTEEKVSCYITLTFTALKGKIISFSLWSHTRT